MHWYMLCWLPTIYTRVESIYTMLRVYKNLASFVQPLDDMAQDIVDYLQQYTRLSLQWLYLQKGRIWFLNPNIILPVMFTLHSKNNDTEFFEISK